MDDQPCFTHGQLYVALSRVGHPDAVRVYLVRSQFLRNRTRLVVYREALLRAGGDESSDHQFTAGQRPDRSNGSPPTLVCAECADHELEDQTVFAGQEPLRPGTYENDMGDEYEPVVFDQQHDEWLWQSAGYGPTDSYWEQAECCDLLSTCDVAVDDGEIEPSDDGAHTEVPVTPAEISFSPAYGCNHDIDSFTGAGHGLMGCDVTSSLMNTVSVRRASVEQCTDDVLDFLAFSGQLNDEELVANGLHVLL